MPITDKTTNIKASDLNTLRGTTGTQISLGQISNTWYGYTSSNVSLGKDFVSTFSNTQLTTVKDSVLDTTNPNDWYHRGQYSGGETIAISGDGNRMAVGVDGRGVYIHTRSGSTWVLDTFHQVDAANTGNGGTCSDVALNYDGTTCAFSEMYYAISAVGAAFYNIPGRVTILTKSGSTWSRQARVVPTGYTTDTTSFGTTLETSALAFSKDGNTLAVASPLDPGTRNPNTTGTNEGAIYIFVRSGTTWTQQARLTSAARYGTLVASYDQKLGRNGVGISSDGNTVMAGGPNDSVSWGAVVVWTRSGTTWTQQVRLASDGTDAGLGTYWGYGTSLSTDGNMFISTTEDYANNVQRAYIYTRSGTTWTKQQSLNLTSIGVFSWYPSMSTSNNANTLLISESSNTHVFTRSGSTWTKQQTLVNSNTVSGLSTIIRSVTSNTGNTLIETTGTQGGAKTYIKSGSTWVVSGTDTYVQPANTNSQVLSPYVNKAGDVYGLAAYRPYDAFVKLSNSEPHFTSSTFVVAAQDSTRKFSVTFGFDELTMSSDLNYMAAYNHQAANNIGALTGSVTVYANTSGTWIEQSYIQPQDVKGNGISMRIGLNSKLSSDGTTLVISADGDSTSNTNAGSVYVYKRSGTTWSQLQKLSLAATYINTYFGSGGLASSSNGSTIAIGSYQENSQNGSVRVYTFGGASYSLQQLIPFVKIGTTSTQKPYFGYKVALSGDGNTMAVSAIYDMPAGQTPVTYTGLVHIYTRTAGVWTRKTSLSASPAANLYWTQNQMHLSGDGYLLIVPSPSNTSVYVFKRNTSAGDSWTQTHKISASDTANNALFGTYASIDKNFTRMSVSGTKGVWVFK